MLTDCHTHDNCTSCKGQWPPCVWQPSWAENGTDSGECLSMIDHYDDLPTMPVVFDLMYPGSNETEPIEFATTQTTDVGGGHTPHYCNASDGVGGRAAPNAMCSSAYGVGWAVAAWEDLEALDYDDRMNFMHLLHLDVHDEGVRCVGGWRRQRGRQGHRCRPSSTQLRAFV